MEDPPPQLACDCWAVFALATGAVTRREVYAPALATDNPADSYLDVHVAGLPGLYSVYADVVITNPLAQSYGVAPQTRTGHAAETVAHLKHRRYPSTGGE